jgi:hypothetical protein
VFRYADRNFRDLPGPVLPVVLILNTTCVLNYLQEASGGRVRISLVH